MRILPYEDRYKNRALLFVKKFYEEEGLKNLGRFEPEEVLKSIEPYKDLCWLLQIKDKVVGFLGGIPRKSPIGSERVFQEILWYVLPDYRRYSVRFFNQVAERVKDKGFEIMVTGCIDNHNLERMQKLYRRLGFKLLELQYIKHLGG